MKDQEYAGLTTSLYGLTCQGSACYTTVYTRELHGDGDDGITAVTTVVPR